MMTKSQIALHTLVGHLAIYELHEIPVAHTKQAAVAGVRRHNERSEGIGFGR
jgi:hypothetical protein